MNGSPMGTKLPSDMVTETNLVFVTQHSLKGNYNVALATFTMHTKSR